MRYNIHILYKNLFYNNFESGKSVGGRSRIVEGSYSEEFVIPVIEVDPKQIKCKNGLLKSSLIVWEKFKMLE